MPTDSILIALAILAAIIILLLVLDRLEFLSVFSRRRRGPTGGSRNSDPSSR